SKPTAAHQCSKSRLTSTASSHRHGQPMVIDPGQNERKPMNPISLIKALLMNAACVNATAVCANTAGTEPPIDPLIQDTHLQGKGVVFYETAMIQYAALLRAFEDQSGVWPVPHVPAGQMPPGAPAGAPLANVCRVAWSVLSALPAGATFAS